MFCSVLYDEDSSFHLYDDDIVLCLSVIKPVPGSKINAVRSGPALDSVRAPRLQDLLRSQVSSGVNSLPVCWSRPDPNLV